MNREILKYLNHSQKLSFLHVCMYVFILEVLGRPTSQDTGAHNEWLWMIMMAKWHSGTFRPKASWHLSYRWGKTLKKPHPGNLSWPGIKPGPLHDRRACYHLSHSSGPDFFTLSMLSPTLMHKMTAWTDMLMSRSIDMFWYHSFLFRPLVQSYRMICWSFRIFKINPPGNVINEKGNTMESNYKSIIKTWHSKSINK